MTDEHDTALLDTSVIIDFDELASELPTSFTISAVTLAELSTGLYTVTDPVERARRQLRLQWAEATFNPLPFDAEAARTHGSLAGLIAAKGRNPRERLADIQIAAIAVSNGLPLCTRNPKDFIGLEAFLNVVAL